MSLSKLSELTPEEKIIRARVKAQDPDTGNPFFAYLLLYLKLHESTPDKIETMAVDKNANLYYNPQFVNDLTEEELKGVLCHEIMHVALEHLIRMRSETSRDMWNIATDIAINNMLVNNNITLPKCGLIPKNNSITLDKIRVDNIESKTAEDIYAEIFDNCDCKCKGFDSHIYIENPDEDRDEKTDGGAGTEQVDWPSVLMQAAVFAEQRGQLPAGMDRYIDAIKNPKANWKSILRKYIQQYIPNDYTWAKRSKKSYSCGFYLPSSSKEHLEIAVGIDTSGSIGQEQLSEFMSEIVGIADSFKQIMTVTVMCHDYIVHTNEKISQVNRNKVKNIQIKGGGGTSHQDILDKIDKKTRVAIFFTDGYSDIDNINLKNYPFDKIFVIDKHGIAPKNPHCMKIHL